MKMYNDEPIKCQPHKMIKHTQTIRRLLRTNCLTVFDHFVGLPLTGLSKSNFIWILFKETSIAKQLYISILNYFIVNNFKKAILYLIMIQAPDTNPSPLYWTRQDVHHTEI